MKDKLVYISDNHINTRLLRNKTCELSLSNPKACILNPKIIFSHLKNEEFMENSLTLLDMCDEMWVVGEVWDANKYEVEYCREHKIPIKAVRR